MAEQRKMNFNLLIVDDEKYVLEDIETSLDKEKLHIEKTFTALNIQSARNILKTENIHIMLSDIDMPGGNGLILVKELQEERPEIPVILITCHADFGYAKEAIRLGCIDYLLKPIDYDELEELLVRVQKKILDELNDNVKYESYRPVTERIMNDYSDSDAAEQKKDYVVLAVNYIQENLTENVTRESVAEAIHVTPDYLDRLFRKKFHVSVFRYINDRKIALAENLLTQSDIPISRISSELGFSNMSNFAALFKKNNGCTPNEYRKKAQEREEKSRSDKS